mmetsp:Transcript_12183/g.48931  ORF Transcript_12183/g.48931 Transcript_12183/m.48931 type:complete len:245 (-) Transcript_12183:143-877(-)
MMRSPCSVASSATLTVSDSVTAPVTPRVLDNVVAPVTARVPVTTVLPVAESTENLVDATLKFPVVSSVPEIDTALDARVTRSGSPSMPIVLSVKRTCSTSTYPFVLLMVSPPVAAECVRAAAASDMIRFFCSVASRATFRVSDKVVALLTPSVLLSVVAPFTPRVLDSDADVNDVVPVTPRVPPTAVLPLAAVTWNLVLSTTVKSPVDVAVPSMVTAETPRVTKSGSLATPIVLPVNRTDSTST